MYFFQYSASHPHLPSFPTRRSSDLDLRPDISFQRSNFFGKGAEDQAVDRFDAKLLRRLTLGLCIVGHTALAGDALAESDRSEERRVGKKCSSRGAQNR